MQHVMKRNVTILMATAMSALILSGCGEEKAAPSGGIEPKVYTDSLFAVMKADRTNYTKMIIGRLGPAGADSIKPHEYWEDLENGAPLPAQMAAPMRPAGGKPPRRGRRSRKSQRA